MSDSPLRVAIITGSTREGRFGPTVARWFVTQARQRDDLRLDVIDLVDFDLPAVMPARPSAAVAAYAARIDAADAFVVVTPEYNHGYPAALKQAIHRSRPFGVERQAGRVRVLRRHGRGPASRGAAAPGVR